MTDHPPALADALARIGVHLPNPPRRNALADIDPALICELAAAAADAADAHRRLSAALE